MGFLDPWLRLNPQEVRGHQEGVTAWLPPHWAMWQWLDPVPKVQPPFCSHSSRGHDLSLSLSFTSQQVLHPLHPRSLQV